MTEIIIRKAGEPQLLRHPLSEAWGDMPPDTLADFDAEVESAGITSPVDTFGGQVLDGWHRYCASIRVGIDCPIREFEGDEQDAIDYVIRMNLHRRHLSHIEAAVAAVKCIGLGSHGGDRRTKTFREKRIETVRSLAERIGVSTATISRANRRIREERGEIPPRPPKAEKGTADAEAPTEEKAGGLPEVHAADEPDGGGVASRAVEAEAPAAVADPDDSAAPAPDDATAEDPVVAATYGEQDAIIIDDLRKVNAALREDLDGAEATITELRAKRRILVERLDKVETALAAEKEAHAETADALTKIKQATPGRAARQLDAAREREKRMKDAHAKNLAAARNERTEAVRNYKRSATALERAEKKVVELREAVKAADAENRTLNQTIKALRAKVKKQRAEISASWKSK